MIRKTFTLLLLALGIAAAPAQTTREEVLADINKAGGVYYAYPVTKTNPTPAPKGYEPFHISHYGRHGSRYLIGDEDYKRVARTLHEADRAGKLTPLGRDVMLRLDTVIQETHLRGGDLSPVGVRQQRGIAERMAADYPAVFKGKTPISARSTIVGRCILTMDAFCERLKEINPQLQTTRESSERYMGYLNYHSPESNEFTSGIWKERLRKFENEHVNGDRLAASLFSDPEYVKNYINPTDLMWGLYWIAVGMQDIETPISFYDIFTPDELFDVWQCVNYGFYVRDGNYPGSNGMLLDNAKPLLRNIIATAEEAIASPEPSVALRFGHDGNLIPLTGLLRLEGCYNQEWDPDKFYTAFSDFKIAPMAGNVQIIFFRNKKNPDDVLVKFLHNEQETAIPVKTDIFPFYHWKDVKAFYENEILP